MSMAMSSEGGEVPSAGGGGNGDFEVSVSDPIKMGDSMNGFVTYRVSVKTRLPQYKHAEFYVIRRFSDFHLLHQRLQNRNPGVIVPPLPEKNVVEKFRFTKDFIEVRRVALEVYLREVTFHSVLKYSVDLQLFLEASEEEWKHEKAKGVGNSGVGKKMMRDIQQGASAMVGKEVREDDPNYLSIKQYFLTLEQVLEDVHKQIERLVSRQKDLGELLEEFGESMVGTGEFEGGEIKRKFAAVGKHATGASKSMINRHYELAEKFEKPIKKALRSIENVKSAMDDRDNAYHQHRVLCEDVDNKRNKLAKANATGTQEVRAKQLEADISETERKREAAKDSFDFIVERLNSEITRYQFERAHTVSEVLSEFSKIQMGLTSEVCKEWSSLLPELDTPAV